MSVVKNFLLSIDDFQLRAEGIELADHSVTALQGPSGSGKTTFVRALLGLTSIESGEWIFEEDGKSFDLLSLPISERRLGVVFQDYALFPHLTAKQNIFFAAEARKIPTEERERLYKLFYSQLDLKNFENTRASKLSGGESQRVALARALMGKPRFLILDEAFVSLDSENKTKAYQLCKSVLSETQTPTLLITHDSSEVEAFNAKRLTITNGFIS